MDSGFIGVPLPIFTRVMTPPYRSPSVQSTSNVSPLANGTRRHNGLKSISGALQSHGYNRLRIGVGQKPEGEDLSDWVLAPMPDEDEEVVVGLLPEMTEAVEVWIGEGVEAAMNRFNGN